MYEEPILFSHCSYGRARVLSLNHANNNNTWISVCRFCIQSSTRISFGLSFATHRYKHTNTHIHACRHSGSGVLCMELWANFARKRKTNNFHIHYDVLQTIHSFVFASMLHESQVNMSWYVCVCMCVCNRETNQRPTKREKDAINRLKRLDKPNRLNN